MNMIVLTLTKKKSLSFCKITNSLKGSLSFKKLINTRHIFYDLGLPPLFRLICRLSYIFNTVVNLYLFEKNTY